MKLFPTPPVLSGKKTKKQKKLLKAQKKAMKHALAPANPTEKAAPAACLGVVLSDRAYLSVLAEVYSRDPLETGGIFFGNVKKGVWYVAEASDPGVYTLHTYAHHEMDNNYHNHIYPVLSRLYKHELTLLGLWHRHPGSFDAFSSDDDKTNAKFAEAVGNGTVSMLVNLDPTARLTCYYLDKNNEYRTVPVFVGDKYFADTGFLTLTSPETLLENKDRLKAEVFHPEEA